MRDEHYTEPPFEYVSSMSDLFGDNSSVHVYDTVHGGKDDGKDRGKKDIASNKESCSHIASSTGITDLSPSCPGHGHGHGHGHGPWSQWTGLQSYAHLPVSRDWPELVKQSAIAGQHLLVTNDRPDVRKKRAGEVLECLFEMLRTSHKQQHPAIRQMLASHYLQVCVRLTWWQSVLIEREGRGGEGRVVRYH